MTSVRLDAATHARVAAAASLAGMHKSAFCALAISDAVKSIMVYDKNKFAAQADCRAQDEPET